MGQSKLRTEDAKFFEFGQKINFDLGSAFFFQSIKNIIYLMVEGPHFSNFIKIRLEIRISFGTDGGITVAHSGHFLSIWSIWPQTRICDNLLNFS